MLLKVEKSPACQAGALAHPGPEVNNDRYTTITLLCGERVVQIPTGIEDIAYGPDGGLRQDSRYKARIERAGHLAAEALTAFCVSCPNRTGRSELALLPNSATDENRSELD